MNGVTHYNPRGQAWRAFQPYLGEPRDKNGAWQMPPSSAPASEWAYDALGRSVEVRTPPDDDGVRARRTTQYKPLMVIESDGEDNLPGGPHADTPKTLVHDGMNRLIEVREIEALSNADSGTFITRYRYALPNLLAEVEDAKGNVKYMRFDALGREIFMNDCDRGHMTNTYDAVGNLLSTVDAKSQRIEYTYDGANRLLSEDYIDNASPLSLHRTPDVAYHYDRPSVDYPWLANTRGQLAWVEDLTGTTYHGFDARAYVERLIKRINQADGTMRDFTTATLSDSLGREYQTNYPDGSVVRRCYDERGLLHAIPRFVDAIAYRASAKKETCAYANGVTTTYTYDPRLRLTRIVTASTSETLQRLSYRYDQSDNVVAIADGRALPSGDPRVQTAQFELDNSYRLQRAIGDGYGIIEYDYDRLGNMVTKISPDIADPLVDMGTMHSGGTMGTSGRIGRSAVDPPGPHAITTITGAVPRTFAYDANGNMTAQDADLLTFDFKDRLGQFAKDGKNTRYFYDYTDRRVIKRVDGRQTTYISKLSEIRDGEMIHYVFSDGSRVARFEGSLAPPAEITQRVHLRTGWNLISFQVDPGVSDPGALLLDIADSVSAVFGYDDHAFISWSPGAENNTLAAFLPNRGYWFRMTGPAELTLTGSLHTATDDDPSEGWQLVGISGLVPRDRPSTQLTFPDADSVWTYAGDKLGWRVMHLNEPSLVSNMNATSTGLGYWVRPRGLAASNGIAPPDVKAAFYHANHIGSTNVMSDESSALSAETLYYPFGASRHEFRPPGGEPVEPNYLFGGKERDVESGLHYFEARYCNTDSARFVSSDASISEDPTPYLPTPQAMNLYAYALNNPFRFGDPTGNDPVPGNEEVKSAGGFMDIYGAITAFVTEKAASQAVQAAPTLVPVRPNTATVRLAGRLKAAAPVTGFVGNVLGAAGVSLSLLEAAEGALGGEADKVVGGIADASAGVYSMAAGLPGVVFGGGYAVGGIAAGQIDKNTGWYDKAAAHGRATEQVVADITGNETVGTVAGAVIAGAQSINPFRFVWDPDVDSD